MRSLVIALLATLLSSSVFAQAKLNKSIRSHYNTLRARGMGNAITASVDDYSALFFNPSALAGLKEAQIHMNIMAGFTSSFATFGDDIKTATSESNPVTRATNVDAVLQKYNGESFYSTAELGGIWARPGWAFGFIPGKLDLELIAKHDTDPTLSKLSITANLDSTFAFAYAKQVKSKFNVGATVKAIYRGFVGKEITAAALLDDNFFSRDDAKEGMAIDVDLGMQYKHGKMGPFNATFAAVGRNLIDGGFTQNLKLFGDQPGEPDKLQRRLDLGSEFEMKEFWVFTPRWMFDIRNIGHDEWTMRKGSHLGLELAWKAKSWLLGAYRVGLNQGYFTAGITLHLAAFRLDLATWSDEVGDDDEKSESRRVAVEMSLDF